MNFTKHTNKWFIFVSTLCSLLETVSNKPCKSYADCIEDIECSICASEAADKSLHCVYPYPELFMEDKKCTYKKTCKDDCNKRGKCVKEPKGLYVAYCNCNDTFYGATCEREWKELPISKYSFFVRFAMLRRVDVSSERSQFYEVFYKPIPGIDPADNMVTTLETDEGSYDVVHLNLHKIETVYLEYYKRFKFVARFKILFPFKLWNGESSNMFLTNGDRIIGYRTNISVSVYVFGKEMYFSKFSVMVSYQDVYLKCTPVIKLSNCASSKTAPVQILRSQRLQVASSVSYLEDGFLISTSKTKADCIASANYEWRMFLLNLGPKISKQWLCSKTYYGKDAFVSDPYTLDFGLYQLILEISVVGTEDSSTNEAYCYIQVKSEPLVALIDGGNDRKVFKKFGLRLSAMRSKDPNMPDSQQDHVYLQWSCVREDAPQVQDPLCKPKRLRVGEIYNINPDDLTYSAGYKFTLTVGVWSKDSYDSCETCDFHPKQAHLRVEVGAKDDKTPNVIITCVQNCGPMVAPNRMLILKANLEYDSKSRYNFKWTFIKNDQSNEQAVDSVVVKGMPSSILIIKENTFEEGTNYTILARVEANEWYTKYTFTTDKMAYDEKCEVQPPSGVKGATSFDVKCTLPQNGVFTFEFYDKTEDEYNEGVIFNGRMLGTSNSGLLHDVRLTRGTVSIYILNNIGLYRNQKIQVKLTDRLINNDVMVEINKNLTESMELDEISKTLEFISFIPDILPSEFDKKAIFDDILRRISVIPISTLPEVKLGASTVSNVLVTLNKPTQLLLAPHLMERTLAFIRRMVEIVMKQLKHREQSQYLNPKEIKLVVEALTNCLQATLLCKDNSILGVVGDNLDLRDLYKLRDGAAATENIIDQVKDIMSYLQSPGQPPTKLASKGDGIVVWAIKNDEEFNLQKLLALERNISVTIPDRLQSKLELKTGNQDELALQVVDIKDNIFWWRASDVKSKLTSVSLAIQAKDRNIIQIKQVSPPLSISFTMPDDLKGIVMSGNVRQPDPNLDPTSLDSAVQIHRLDPKPGSFLSINFIFPSTNSTLRVLLMRNLRPDYEMITTSPHTVLITLKNSVYPHNHYHYGEPTFFFLGILPGPEVPVNEAVAYHLEVNTTLCQFWAAGWWTSEGCQMDVATKGKGVTCQCSHLSIFAAAFPVPPEDIDPFADSKLFLTVLDNPLVVGFVSSILLLYFLICLLVWCQDRTNKYRQTVIVLDDNFPNDTYPYLLAIFTSSRFNAGTTARVGFKIYGASSNSRPHILSCKYRKVLRKNTDDWFLIFCPKPLGEITSLQIWHDNSGSSPDWFCKKIYVYDLKLNTETMFVVEQWVALRTDDYPEANIVPAASHDVLNVKRMFLENFVIGLIEGHILLRILLSHPRSHVSRLEKVSIFMVMLMISMLCSIMFYKPDSDDTAGLDDFQYSFGSRELFISIECLVISGVLGSLVLFTFGKAYKHKYLFHRTTLQLRKSDLSISPSSDSKLYNSDLEKISQPRKKKTLFRHFMDVLIKAAKPQPFVPVLMPGSEAVVQVRRFWLVAAWTICLLIIFTCSYLVMLYGLKMGLINSKKWLTTVLMTLGEDIFVSGPTRIIMFALILSFAFHRMFIVNTYNVSLKDVEQQDTPDIEDYVMKIIIKRKHAMYKPLSIAVRQEILRKLNTRKKWWTFIDFCISIGFVVVVSSVAFVLWSSHYYTSSHVTSLVTSYQVTFVTSPKFFEVRSIPEMNSYLENTLKLSLFRLRWNNGEKIDNDDGLKPKYWTADGSNKMIGLPSIRQLRVGVEFCKTIYPSLKKCVPHWSYSSEDTDVFGPQWSVASWDDSNTINTPWSYTIRDSIPAMLIIFNRLYGGSGNLYDTSGYLATLGPSRDDAERTLSELNMNNWQDPRSRVLFVELTLYNPNEDLLSQVTLIAEYLVSGTLIVKAHVNSQSSSLILGYWSLVFVGYIVWYVFRSGYMINQFGLLEYLSAGLNNVFRLVVTAVGVIAIVIYFTHLLYAAEYFKEFQDSGSDTYFDFDAYSYYFTQTKIVLSILIAIAFWRTILFLRFGRTLISHYYNFVLSLRWILWLTALLVVMVMVLQQMTYLINVVPIFRIKELVINKNSLQDVETLDHITTALLVFIIVKTVLVFLVSIFYIIFFMYFAKLARNYKLKTTDTFNFLTFIGEELRYKRRTLKGKLF